MGDVVWNVDGQRGDLRLHRLHRRLGQLPLHLLPGGQRREGDFDVCAGEAERAPARRSTRTYQQNPLYCMNWMCFCLISLLNIVSIIDMLDVNVFELEPYNLFICFYQSMNVTILDNIKVLIIKLCLIIVSEVCWHQFHS